MMKSDFKPCNGVAQSDDRQDNPAPKRTEPQLLVSAGPAETDSRLFLVNPLPCSEDGDGHGCRIIDYTGTNCKEVVIPKQINGMPVTSIGEGAFEGHTELTSVSVLGNVLKVGDSAFKGCTNLTKVKFSDSLQVIGESAFQDSTKLVDIDLGRSCLRKIGDRAFSGCTSLTRVAFLGCVAEVGNYTFSGCSSLTNISFPKSVKIIGRGAFAACISLTDLWIPAYIQEIQEVAFAYCIGMKEVMIESAKTKIDEIAFASCMSLSNIEVPEIDYVWEPEFGNYYDEPCYKPFRPDTLHSQFTMDGIIDTICRKTFGDRILPDGHPYGW